jgi:hypothetical protein
MLAGAVATEPRLLFLEAVLGKTRVCFTVSPVLLLRAHHTIERPG